MLRNEALLRDILEGARPDYFKPQWSQPSPQWGSEMAVEIETGLLLHALVRAVRPDNVIETGTHKGFSAMILAQALENNGHGKLYTIDLTDHRVQALSEKYGLAGRVTFIQGDSRIELAKLAKTLGRFSFLWLDSDHDDTVVLAEIAAAAPALQPGSFVAFHDTLSDPREAAAVAEIRKWHPTWSHVHFATARGFDLMNVQ